MVRKTILAGSLWILAAYTASAQPDQEGRKSYQYVDVISVAGAKCALKREGDEIIPLELPPSDSGNLQLVVVRIDSTKNHNDVSVTCTKEGYKEKMEIVSFGPVSYINDFAPCAPSANVSDAEKNACKQQPLSSTSVTLQYPDAIRVILEPNAG